MFKLGIDKKQEIKLGCLMMSFYNSIFLEKSLFNYFTIRAIFYCFINGNIINKNYLFNPIRIKINMENK